MMKNFIQKNAVTLILFGLTWLIIIPLLLSLQKQKKPSQVEGVFSVLITDTATGKQAPLWGVVVNDLVSRGVIKIQR